MSKVRVMQLSGCNKCHALITKLDILKIKYESVDADKNGALADSMEQMLNAVNYPFITVVQFSITTHLYRADDSVDMGLHFIDHHTNKIGCVTIDGMLEQLLNLLKK